MTQAALAAEMSERLGREMRPLTITRLEGGKRPIGVDELVAAAAALKVEATELLAGSDLPEVAVKALKASRDLEQASKSLRQSVHEWVWAQMRTLAAITRPGALDHFTPGARAVVESEAVRDISDLVAEFQAEAKHRWYTETEDSK